MNTGDMQTDSQSMPARSDVGPSVEGPVRSSDLCLEQLPPPGALAVVLIHGIGDIVPGDVLISSAKALEKHLGVRAVLVPGASSGGQSSGTTGHATVRKAKLHWSDRQIDLVEFNWKSVTGKMRLGHPIDAIRKFLGVLREVPALGSIGSSDSLDRAILSASAWLFQGIFIVSLLTIVVTLGHELARYETYNDEILPLTQHMRQPTSSSDEAAAQGYEVGSKILNVFRRQDSQFHDVSTVILSRTWIALLWAGVFALPLCVLVRVLKGFRVRRALLVLVAAGVGWVLTTLAVFALTIGGLFAFQLGLGLAEARTGLWERLAPTMLISVFFFWLPAKVVIAVANLLRDVVHYLAPDRRGVVTIEQHAIRAQLWQLISGLQAERRYARIVLIAHSLGTVILTDLLLERAPSVGAVQPISIDIVTAGSPLRRLIHRLFPDRTPDLLAVRRQLAEGPGVRVVRWFNAYRLADFVGQALTRSTLLLDLVGLRWVSGDPQTGIRDHLLTPRYRWPLAHANYWMDARFLRFIALEVIRPLLDESTKPSDNRAEQNLIS